MGYRLPQPVASDTERPLPDTRREAGAPKGNRKALKHGRYTAEAIAQRRKVGALLRAARKLLVQDAIQGHTLLDRRGEIGDPATSLGASGWPRRAR
jgi:hypothetical protein